MEENFVTCLIFPCLLGIGLGIILGFIIRYNSEKEE